MRHHAGIYAFPCYGEHHAIVFYADLTTQPPTLLEPTTFCTHILEGHDQARRSAVQNALGRATLPSQVEKLARWRDDYVRVYGHG